MTTHTENASSAYAIRCENCIQSYQQKVDAVLSKYGAITIPHPIARRAAVTTAWYGEWMDIQLGGCGSINFSKAQREIILKTGSLPGYEGHHIIPVSANPHKQANPNNIWFFRDRNEHLQKGHAGNFKNNTVYMPEVDRVKMMEYTARKQLRKIEAKGTALAFGASAAVASCLELINQFSENNFGWKEILTKTLHTAAKAGTIGSFSTILSRLTTPGISRFLLRHNITGKVLEGIVGGIGGSIVSLLFALVEFITYLQKGHSLKASLKQVGKQLGYSLAFTGLLALCHCVLGTTFSMIISVVLTSVLLLPTIIKAIKNVLAFFRNRKAAIASTQSLAAC